MAILGRRSYTGLDRMGVGQAYDPGLTGTNYPQGLFTENATSLKYRDDYQFSTGPTSTTARAA